MNEIVENNFFSDNNELVFFILVFIDIFFRIFSFLNFVETLLRGLRCFGVSSMFHFWVQPL